MTQAILRPNFIQEQKKPYFSAYEGKSKTEVLEKTTFDWQETLHYLLIYWNAADISGVSALLTKELRTEFLGGSNDVMRLYSHMNNLLWKQFRVLFAEKIADHRVQAIVKLKMIDRKMRIWHIDVYMAFEKAEGKFLLCDYELVSMRHIRQKREIVRHEFLAVLIMAHADDLALNNEPKQEEQHKVVIKGGWLMLSADEVEEFSKLLADILHNKTTCAMRISCDGDFAVGIEE